MKNIFTQSSQILLERKPHSRGAGGVKFSASALRCALLVLGVLGGVGMAHGQQPDPLTITRDGNVGVGTITPANKLSVAGNADFSGSVSIGSTTPKGTLTVGNATAGGTYAQDAVSGWRDGYMLFRAGVKKASIGMDSGGAKLQFFTGSTSDDNTARLTVDSSGNIGIGKTDPAKKLDIFSTDSSFGMLRVNNDSTTAGEASIGFFDTNTRTTNAAWVIGVGGWGNTGNFVIGNENGGAGGNVRLLIDKSGKVGIGTSNPTKAKVEINGYGDVSATLGRLAYLTPDNVSVLGNPPVGISGGGTSTSLSLYANGVVAADRFYAFSDERLKRIAGRSVAARDLDTLLSIEVTDYSYIDSIAKGTGMQKKVTGQQVEKVFPQAVSKGTDVVPDIYQKATIKDGWVMLATNLKKGDRVRLIGEQQEGIHEVLEIAEGRFRTAFAADGGQVFVYGREVNDARRVDYEAISMLNVSATQELARRLEKLEEREAQPARLEQKNAEVKALQEENAALRSQLAEQEKRLAELEAKDKSRDEKFAVLETMLMSRDQPATRNASLKKAN